MNSLSWVLEHADATAEYYDPIVCLVDALRTEVNSRFQEYALSFLADDCGFSGAARYVVDFMRQIEGDASYKFDPAKCAIEQERTIRFIPLSFRVAEGRCSSVWSNRCGGLRLSCPSSGGGRRPPHFIVPNEGRWPKVAALQGTCCGVMADGRRTSECPKKGGGRRPPHFSAPVKGRRPKAAALQRFCGRWPNAATLQSTRQGAVAEGSRTPECQKKCCGRRPPYFRVPEGGR